MAIATTSGRTVLSGLKISFQCCCFSTATRRIADNVRIVEVGPRDGLQNERATIPLRSKIELIQRLAQTGVRNIEAGSFVAPKWVPQMANSAEVLYHLRNQAPATTLPISYNFLVPNYKGFENFLNARDAEIQDVATMTSQTNQDIAPSTADSPRTKEGAAKLTSSHDSNGILSDSIGTQRRTTPVEDLGDTMEISLFTAATEAFSKANTNCSIAESLKRYEPIVSVAKSKNIRVRGYVSVALGCPYEGPEVDPNKVTDITRTLLAMGVDEVSVADTTGMGTAPKTQDLMKALLGGGISLDDLALHFHDTYGQALVNIIVGLENGVRTFDSSVGGLGGCPYSKGATGNVATEDLVHCLHSLGMNTGVSLERMAEIGAWISAELGRANDSRAGKAVLARMSS